MIPKSPSAPHGTPIGQNAFSETIAVLCKNETFARMLLRKLMRSGLAPARFSTVGELTSVTRDRLPALVLIGPDATAAEVRTLADDFLGRCLAFRGAGRLSDDELRLLGMIDIVQSIFDCDQTVRLVRFHLREEDLACRRAFPRLKVDGGVPVTLRSESRCVSARLVDLSLGGFSATGPIVGLSLGELITFTCHLGTRIERISGKASTRWVQPDLGPLPVPHSHMKPMGAAAALLGQSAPAAQGQGMSTSPSVAAQGFAPANLAKVGCEFLELDMTTQNTLRIILQELRSKQA